jgi:hypothetical protein
MVSGCEDNRGSINTTRKSHSGTLYICCLSCSEITRYRRSIWFVSPSWPVKILKGPTHTKLNCAVLPYRKTAQKPECSVAQCRFPISFVIFFCQFCVFSYACDYSEWKQGCPLLFASHISRNVIRKEEKKRKLCSRKWYLKRNISCDAHLLNEFLETVTENDCLEMTPSWCRQVNWGNCEILWVNCAVPCLKDDWKGQFWGLRYCLFKLRSLLIFRQVWSHTVKSPSLTESVWCAQGFNQCVTKFMVIGFTLK